MIQNDVIFNKVLKLRNNDVISNPVVQNWQDKVLSFLSRIKNELNNEKLKICLCDRFDY